MQNRRKFVLNLAMGSTALSATPMLTFGAINGQEIKDKPIRDVLDYISSNWSRSVYRDKPGKGYGGIDLPYPYTSPSIKGEGHFTIFFYWDTYFTNLGLLRNGLQEQAKSNIKNMLWLIQEQGYMPNYVGLHNRSQSPYLQLIVRDYFDIVKDESDDFYKVCADGLKKEYQFWMTARSSPIGLNHFGHHDDAKGCIQFYDGALVPRLKLDPNIPEEEKSIIGGHYMAEAENWDFNQRYNGHCLDYAATDLNALLWGYEEFLYEASKNLDWYLKDFYRERVNNRKELINQYLWNEKRGWFFDYDFVNKNQSDVYSLSGMMPMFMGLASEEQAEKMQVNLGLFEREYGIATTDEREGCRKFQWAFPVVWPPLVYIASMSLDRYGYREDAKRIAQKYIDVTVNLFKDTGRLWEKTDAETGRLSMAEYGSEPLMGWTAGVFVALVEYFGF